MYKWRSGHLLWTAGGHLSVGCVECATCAYASIAGSYAVAFAGGVDFDYPAIGKTGDTCGESSPPDGPYTLWDYTVPKSSSYTSCSGYPFGKLYGKRLTNTVVCDDITLYGPQTAPEQGTGLGGIYGPCRWTIAFFVFVCVGTSWQLVGITYSKSTGTTPAGTYTFREAVPRPAWGGFSLASLTYPTTIVLS